jgi:prephenate dehydratase
MTNSPNTPIIFCLGPAGTNAHDVARDYDAATFCVDGVGGQFEFTESNFQSLVGLASSSVPGSVAVVPVENSSEGLVADTRRFWLAMLAKGFGSEFQPAYVVGERHVPIHHCLAVKHSSDKPLYVLSHPQALGQCAEFLRIRGLSPHARPSTAEAASEIAEADSPATGSICSEATAKRYGLHVIDRNIEDQKGNETRFHIVSRLPCEDVTGNDRTALIFELGNQPNALASALNVFGGHSVNLSAIHSMGIGEGRYAFYVEADCHQDDARGQKVLTCLNTLVVGNRLLVLGSYPRSPRPTEGGAQ